MTEYRKHTKAESALCIFASAASALMASLFLYATAHSVFISEDWDFSSVFMAAVFTLFFTWVSVDSLHSFRNRSDHV